MARARPDSPASPAADLELVASVFATRLPTVIMSLLFIGVGAMIAHATRDGVIACLLAAGMLASAVRMSIMVIDGRAIARGLVSIARLPALERRFAASYLAFAVVLGLFCARALAVAPVALHALVGVLVMGYAAGVASGVGLRPRLAVTAIVLAVVPTAGAAAFAGTTVGLALAGVQLAFLAGGLRSMQSRYRSETGRIAQRRVYEVLARQDHLTGIANRRGLEERFARMAAARARDGAVTIHCLDLDGFKAVNDLHGHDAGDALLVAAAARLQTFAENAIAARLGGDEFVVVQFGLADPAAAAAAAIALEAALSQPHVVADVAVAIGASIGTAFGTEPMHTLLHQADTRQRHCKQARKAIAADRADRLRGDGPPSRPAPAPAPRRAAA